MTRHRRLGVLGGTFDPIHVGHLDAAAAAQEALLLDQLVLVPAHDPPHRPILSQTSPYHRFALAALAVNGRRGWRVSDVELRRGGPSYSIDTLRTLHAEGWAPWQLFFVLGADAFADIGAWRGYPDLLDAAHFVVVARPGTPLDRTLVRLPALQSRVVRAEQHTGDERRTRVVLVDAATRDVSSTLIRDRLAQGAAIDDLVTPAVARHIVSHDLYQPVVNVHGGGTEE
jgi:nicotinate-nucleotide adenylyltransferase